MLGYCRSKANAEISVGRNRMAKETFVRVGVLTGGGDCPGLNAVIRAVVRKGVSAYEMEFVGFRDGWRGPLQNETIKLGIPEVRGILPRGGTIQFQVRSPQLGQGAIEVDCAGQQIAWSEEFGRAVDRKLQAEDLTAHNILPYLSAAFADRLGMRLLISQSGPGNLGIRAASR